MGKLPLSDRHRDGRSRIELCFDHSDHMPLSRSKDRVHSFSAESLVHVGLGSSSSFLDQANDSEAANTDVARMSTTSRFVRKVTSSFRFRKNLSPSLTKKTCDYVDENALLGPSLTPDEPYSAPHSPQNDTSLHTSPRPHSSKETTVSGEKGFNRFAWFPSRSPRRVVAKAVPEHVNRIGVVMPCDTLESLSGREYNRVPVFVKECIEYIEKEGGLEAEGIYRVPGSQAQVAELESSFVVDGAIAFRIAKLPVNAVATALKNFLASLPEPLISYEMYNDLLPCLKYEQSEALALIASKLEKWPEANQKTFLCLGAHLARVAQHADVNNMDIRNLAKVWWPTLFRPHFDSFASMASFVTRLELAAQLLITYAAEHYENI
ncbi:unnamed protein product [Enterobius vermicularis]|uniref:Rho-GAP domain-containing protein n=1 Tax=Enterobius vermicularis TaxID=51028 RepID=A0A0N4V714_ENTVE|nr:unnamed protein product [Enterobius vermicularis]